jgi:hypothetical protein
MKRTERSRLLETATVSHPAGANRATSDEALAQMALAMGMRIVRNDERPEKPFELFAEDPERWDGMS